MTFASERQLFEKTITSPFLPNFVDSLVYPTFACIEPKGLFGIPDLVIANVEQADDNLEIMRSFAFELKALKLEASSNSSLSLFGLCKLFFCNFR